MKQTILAVATLITLSTGSAYANKGEDVSNTVISSFSHDFSSAKNVNWQKEKNYVKATFTLNEQVMYAYYNAQGEMIGAVRNILADQLPINLVTELRNGYNGYWITDLFEMASGGETTYYVTLESADQIIVLKSNGSNSWEVYQKTKKNIA